MDIEEAALQVYTDVVSRIFTSGVDRLVKKEHSFQTFGVGIHATELAAHVTVEAIFRYLDVSVSVDELHDKLLKIRSSLVAQFAHAFTSSELEILFTDWVAGPELKQVAQSLLFDRERDIADEVQVAIVESLLKDRGYDMENPEILVFDSNNLTEDDKVLLIALGIPFEEE